MLAACRCPCNQSAACMAGKRHLLCQLHVQSFITSLQSVPAIASATACSNQAAQCSDTHLCIASRSQCSISGNNHPESLRQTHQGVPRRLAQENPNAIPEGETPHSVTMLCFEDMIDVAKPGDRVTVTGIYKALPVRVNPRQRAIKSVYKTHIMALHVHKDGQSELFSLSGEPQQHGHHCGEGGCLRQSWHPLQL